MAKPLVIVESPAKAKTISKFLGATFDVRASVGHVADLPSKGLNIDVENGFTPTYELTDRGKQVVKDLKAALEVHQTLAWKVFRFATSSSPLASARHLPGHTGMSALRQANALAA